MSMRNADWTMRSPTKTLAVVLGSLTAAVYAQAEQKPAPAARSAPKLVRQGNDLLLGDKPAEALRAYGQAEALRPDSREIAFDQALAHFRLGQLDEAREAFRNAAAGAADKLADDAQYGLGTCDHAEALASEDPKNAVSKLENAMRQYQEVLAANPDHAAARDANFKAASYWRQLKQQEQQPQPQQGENNQDQDQQDQQQSQQNEQQQQEQTQQDESKQSQEQQTQSQQDQEEQESESARNQEQQEQTQQQEQQASQDKEEASREQAERKLRELMQAMRDRKKHRKDEPEPLRYRPVEKDW